MIPANEPPDQGQFLSALSVQSQFHHAFDHLRGLAFFAKDRHLRIIACCANFYRRFGFESEQEIIGKTDHELAPAYLVEHFMADDLEVMRTHQPKLNIVEVFLNDFGIPDWYLTNKMPLFDKEGEIVGLMGTTRPYNSSKDTHHPDRAVEKALRFIQQNYRKNPTVQEVAETTGISLRQLHRKFMTAFRATPKDILQKLRIRAVCDMLLETDNSIGEIAVALHYRDQATLGRAFKDVMGLTPLDYRRNRVG
jgi:AraC-like DNA-binding protein